MSDENVATLSAAWQARGIAPTLDARREDGTLAAPDLRLGTGPTLLADAVSERTLAVLAAVSSERLSMGALLGRGGMGEVRSAQQASLRREVAVKTVLDPTRGSSREALLKEAWVGAALEHPNVAPIHTLARVGDGIAVVMKRIEGTSWAQVLAGSGGHERFRGKTAFEAHLRVLGEVCRAVAFAHRKGVLHLDLKPENVMLGDFGEVYVLDWGLACATVDGPTWLARATTLGGPAGTPAYMAPELAAADGDKVDRHTDVYLLGAILHELVTGRPPHDAPTVLAALAHAFTSEKVEYGPEVPRELASILGTALKREPSQRFQSADALREAIDGFLRHRGAEHFVDRADEGLTEIDSRLARGIDPEIEPRLSEIEVAIEQARREWPEHPRLGALERALVERRTRHAILEGRLEAAVAFHAQLVDAATELGAQIELLRRSLDERARHVESLEAIGRELDLTLGGRERQFLFTVLGGTWAVVGVMFGILDRSGILRIGYRELLLFGALLVATFLPYGLARRRTFFQNRANRRLYGGLIFTAVAVEVWWVAGILLHVPVRSALALTPLFYTYAFATLAIVLDRRFFRGAIALLLTAGFSALFPAWSLDCIGLGGAAATALTLHAWRTR